MNARKPRCNACRTDVATPDFTMAFQPIVDIDTSAVYAYEALVRPIGGGTAAQVLDQITDENRYAFDQGCRVKAITLAARLGMEAMLSTISFPTRSISPRPVCRKPSRPPSRRGFRCTI